MSSKVTVLNVWLPNTVTWEQLKCKFPDDAHELLKENVEGAGSRNLYFSKSLGSIDLEKFAFESSHSLRECNIVNIINLGSDLLQY
jgi:hypothetical protein